MVFQKNLTSFLSSRPVLFKKMADSGRGGQFEVTHPQEANNLDGEKATRQELLLQLLDSPLELSGGC